MGWMMHQLLLAPKVNPSLSSYFFIMIVCLLQAPECGKQEAALKMDHPLALLISATEDLRARDNLIINLVIDWKTTKTV